MKLEAKQRLEAANPEKTLSSEDKLALMKIMKEIFIDVKTILKELSSKEVDEMHLKTIKYDTGTLYRNAKKSFDVMGKY